MDKVNPELPTSQGLPLHRLRNQPQQNLATPFSANNLSRVASGEFRAPETEFKHMQFLNTIARNSLPPEMQQLVNLNEVKDDRTFIKEALRVLTTANDYFFDPKRMPAPEGSDAVTLDEAIGKLPRMIDLVRKKKELEDLLIQTTKPGNEHLKPMIKYFERDVHQAYSHLQHDLLNLLSGYDGWKARYIDTTDESNPRQISKTKTANCIGFAALYANALTQNSYATVPIEDFRILLSGYHTSVMQDDTSRQFYDSQTDATVTDFASGDSKQKGTRVNSTMSVQAVEGATGTKNLKEIAPLLDELQDTRFNVDIYGLKEGIALAQLIQYVITYKGPLNLGATSEEKKQLLEAIQLQYPENQFVKKQILYYSSPLSNVSTPVIFN